MRKKPMLSLTIFVFAALSIRPANLMAATSVVSPNQQNPDDISSSFQCPENYPSNAAKQTALSEFIREYAARFPHQTVHDMMVYRYHLLVSHSCVQTLRYMLAHVSPTAEMLRFNDQDYGPKAEEFDPTSKVWTVYFKEDGAPQEQPNKELIFNFYGWDPPISPHSIVQAWLNRGDNVHTIWKFEAPDDITKDPAYIVVSETIYPSQPFGYINLTKISSIGTGAYAVTFSKKVIGSDSAEIEKNIKIWLLSEEGRTTSRAIGYVGTDAIWQAYLTKPHGQ